MAFSITKSGASAVGIRLLLIIGLVFLHTDIQGHEQKVFDEQLEQGRSFFEAGKLARAAEVLEEIVKTRHDSEDARGMLFTCYRFMGIEYYGMSRYEDAINVWQKALDLEPTNREIQVYITRVNSELKSIAIISGDTTMVEKYTARSSALQEILVDTVFVSLPLEVDSIFIPAIEKDEYQSGDGLTIGVSSGAAIATGELENPGTGIDFTGHISYLPHDKWFGVRAIGSCTRFYKNARGTTSSSRHISISGIGISGLGRMKISNRYSILLYTGIGIYDIILTDQEDRLSPTVTRKSSDIGMSLGVGLRKNWRNITAIMDAKYIYISNSIGPNILTISVGITSK
ncbi:MAG: hypothetical protein KAR42_13420 [candidate division Zixibacteria bacterium]|nr:hypothetical protein [candidate division Zixibacteria bacterium]